LEQAIRKAGVAELVGLECFDVFVDDQGAKLDAAKKSLAYALTFRAPDRTLSDKDVVPMEQKIIATVSRETGATLR
ncbi:MAG: phenylalanine--tRNA ligase subunit beta, partial [Candidatus Methylacidiphilales bacterium]